MIPIKPKDATWTDEQWEAIYANGKNIIVSAGAGSGKTAVLTERIIEKIKSGVSINDMIILTFTNAAAAEMKERVRKKILNEVKKNDALKEQLYLIDQAFITTFDAYSLYLIKKYHYLLNISSDVNIIDNVLLDLEKEKYLDEIIEEQYNNKEFLSFLDIYTEKDDSALKKSILGIYNKIDSICKKQEYLDKYLEIYYNSSFIEEKYNDYLKVIRNTSDTTLMLLDAIKNIITNDKLLEKIIAIEEVLDNLNYAKKYEDYKKIIDSFTMPIIKKTKSIEEEDIEEIKEYYEKLKKYVLDLKDLVKYDSQEEIINEVNSTKNYAKVIIEILKKLDNKLLEYKKNNNSYEFSDITRLAIQLLEENEDIRLQIKNNTNEIMIDEYQDTNDIGDYFISLISNNNVYMVGDVKQSIYRFRNANPNIFMEKYHNYKNGIGGYALDLTKNFRSRKEVLNSINEMFNHIMDEEIGGANYKESHNMIYGNTRYDEEGKTNQNYNLEIYNYDYKTTDYRYTYSRDEIEAFIIADDILKRMENKEQVFDMDEKKLKDISFKDFVILIDRKSNFELYKKIFDYKKIPLVVHKEEEFAYSNEIYVLKNILKLINIIKTKDYTSINYPFISVARSYLFNYDDNDIFGSVTNNDILSNSKFVELFDKINSLVDITDTVSLSTLILKTYNIFNFYEKSIRISNVESINKKLDYIVDVALNLEKIGYKLNDFIIYFDNVFDKKLDIKFTNKSDANSNSVNIMSIHNSKGLEYPICYFPSLYKGFNKADLKDRFLFNKDFGIVMPVFKEGLTNTIYKRLLNDSYLKEDIAERLRVLYVALTRAKEKIILLDSIEEASLALLPFQNDLVNNLERLKYSSFQDVLVSIKQTLHQNITKVDSSVNKNYQKNNEIDIREIFKNTSKKIINPIKIKLKEELVNEKRYSNTVNKIEKLTEMTSGLGVHEILEFLDFNNYEEDLNNYDINDYFKAKIKELFKMPFMSNIGNSKIHKEYEFFTEESHGIIDLLIEEEDKFIIVDYKLKEINKPYYVDQVKGYMDYIERTTNKKVEGYLYSIINSEYKSIK